MAAIPLLVGGGISITTALDQASTAQRYYDEALELVCAKERLASLPKPSPQRRPDQGNVFDQFDEQPRKRIVTTEELFSSQDSPVQRTLKDGDKTYEATDDGTKLPWEMDWKAKPGDPDSPKGSGELPPGYVWEDQVKPKDNPFADLIPLDLKDLGCSGTSRKAAKREILAAKVPAEFSYASALLPPFAFGLGMTLIVSLAVYAIVRAIGWVIGGFARA